MGFKIGEAFSAKAAPKATTAASSTASAAGSSSVIDLTGDDDSPAPKRQRPASHPPGTFAPGTELVLHGLERRPVLNGATVRVQSWDEQSKRYTVDVLRLSSGAKPSEADASKAVKSANLKPAARQGTSTLPQPVVIDLDEGDSTPAKRQRGTDKPPGQPATGKARQKTPATGGAPPAPANAPAPAPASSSAPTPTAAAVPPPSLAVGAEVTVRGLESRPDLNGATARVQEWDAQSGRYTVEMLQLASGVKPAAADTSKALKPKNLHPVAARPPPPPQQQQQQQQQAQKENEKENEKKQAERKAALQERVEVRREAERDAVQKQQQQKQQQQQQQAAARAEQEKLQRERQQAAAAERKQKLQREKAERDKERERERERAAAAELQRRREQQEATRAAAAVQARRRVRLRLRRGALSGAEAEERAQRLLGLLDEAAGAAGAAGAVEATLGVGGGRAPSQGLRILVQSCMPEPDVERGAGGEDGGEEDEAASGDEAAKAAAEAAEVAEAAEAIPSLLLVSLGRMGDAPPAPLAALALRRLVRATGAPEAARAAAWLRASVAAAAMGGMRGGAEVGSGAGGEAGGRAGGEAGGDDAEEGAAERVVQWALETTLAAAAVEMLACGDGAYGADRVDSADGAATTAAELPTVPRWPQLPPLCALLAAAVRARLGAARRHEACLRAALAPFEPLVGTGTGAACAAAGGDDSGGGGASTLISAARRLGAAVLVEVHAAPPPHAAPQRAAPPHASPHPAPAALPPQLTAWWEASDLGSRAALLGALEAEVARREPGNGPRGGAWAAAARELLRVLLGHALQADCFARSINAPSSPLPPPTADGGAALPLLWLRPAATLAGGALDAAWEALLLLLTLLIRAMLHDSSDGSLQAGDALRDLTQQHEGWRRARGALNATPMLLWYAAEAFC